MTKEKNFFKAIVNWLFLLTEPSNDKDFLDYLRNEFYKQL